MLKEIGQHLSETLAASIMLEINSDEIEKDGHSFGQKVYVQIEPISFCYELEKNYREIEI